MVKYFRQIANRISLGLLRISFVDRAVGYMSYQRKRVTRRKIEARLRASGAYGDEVMRGPFKGMVYPDPERWASCRFEKVLGFYEFELHPALANFIGSGKQYTDIVIIGAAEGYYAVGLGRAFPSAKVHAFEPHPQRTSVMSDLAKLNGVADRLSIGGFCSPSILKGIALGGQPLVICDVDGYEEIVMNPEEVPWLKSADIVVELHDFIVAKVSELVRSRFEDTHHIDVLSVKNVPFEEFPALRNLPMYEIQAMTESDRPFIQDWFVMVGK